MPNYTQAIEEIKSRCNIVDVISAVAPLKRAGDTYKACCPFHNEKTPSFVVSEKKQFYHCFGCGESGDAFTFLQKYYNIPFLQAVEKLAAQYGVKLEKEDNESSKKRAELLEINRLSARYYFENITKPKNKGFEYITGRGISPDTIKLFGLGYADENWAGLYEYLKANKVSDNSMIELGLVSKSQKNGKFYDKYRSRLMFPIIDTRGKIIGFGGRIIGEGEPKYLNSSESSVFLKKNNLFGLDKSKEAISKEGYAFLVEGYMDMVSLYQSGVKNVVASLGTALTENQAKLLHRYCSKVILCYDADAAGIKAALRGIDVLREAEMEVFVLHVDDGKDPDEYVKKQGPENFIKLANKKALADVYYKVALIGKKYNINDTRENIKFLKAVAEVLRSLSPVETEVYIKELSQKFSISEDSLRNEVQFGSKAVTANIEKKEKDQKTSEKITQASKADLKLEQMIFKLSFINSTYFKTFVSYDNAFISDMGMSIASTLSSMYKDDAEFDIDVIKDYLDENELVYLKQTINNTLVGDEGLAFKDCINRLEKKTKEKKENQLKLSIQMLDEMPEGDNKNNMFKQLADELSALRNN